MRCCWEPRMVRLRRALGRGSIPVPTLRTRDRPPLIVDRGRCECWVGWRQVENQNLDLLGTQRDARRHAAVWRFAGAGPSAVEIYLCRWLR